MWISSKKFGGSPRRLPQGVIATVILGNDGFMLSQKVPGGGTFRFAQVPDGTYFLKVQAPGYDAGPARQVSVAPVALKMVMGDPAVDAEPASQPLDFQFAPLPGSQFKYDWQEICSRPPTCPVR
ncbi:MAG TPA: carboxypeptidase-like regulatory domain-containing protein [Polyangia bacterium]